MLSITLVGKNKYTVALTNDQRSFLEGLVHRDESSASTIRHVYILPHADKPDPEVAEFFWCYLNMFNVREAFITERFDAALRRKFRGEPPNPQKLDNAG